MSLIDEFAALAEEFSQGDFFTDATITRKSTQNFDPIAGTVTASSAPIACRAVASRGEYTNDNGATVEATMITANVALKSGDKITIGPKDFTIGKVMETAPHGLGFLWKAVAA